MELERQIQTAVGILKKGGVVAFPTDTVYGAGASAFDEHAVRRVYEAKRRSYSLPLPLLLADITQLADVVCAASPLAECLARKFWPGGLTIIGHKSSDVLNIVTGGSNTVAVRVPNHYVPIALIRGLGAPIVGTSANISGMPSAVTGEDVRRQMGESVDFIVDDGVGCIGGMESTIVDVTAGVVRILREGAIQAKEIMEECSSALGEER